MKEENSRRLTFIDALRGVASLGVVIFHAVEGNHVNNLPDFVRQAASYGALGVPIFFVISGFVIAHSLRDQRMTPANFVRFVARRSIRLDPPYWTAIALAIGFSMLAAKVVPGRPSELFTTAQILAHLTYTQNILGFNNINPVFWTLCYEVQFYIVFAWLLFARRMLFAGALLVSLLWCFRIAPDAPSWFPNLWFAFLLGASAWYGWKYRAMVPIYLAYLFAVAASAIWYHDVFAIACVITSSLIFAVAMTKQIENGLNWRWLQFLGTVSYSLYLIHNPVTGAVFRIGKIVTGDGLMSEAFWWCASIVACIATAAAMWFSVERYSMHLSRRLFQGPAPSGAQTSTTSNLNLSQDYESSTNAGE
ncbi:acyltransferase family protein [Bradyrhizobium sp. GCM10023182]|uniref:Acyltransferase n=1 Tax=Bradyrhizobium zhengyangense TaxID=2911009 RepID=A0ABS9M1T8_9BRAD|nr:acyltransferase [Bradyrhizobium zhengyangense]